MTTAYKVLGQVNPSAATATTLYTVPSATSSVCSTLAVCNQSTATTIRVSVRPAGASIVAKHYLLYEVPMAANETQFYTIGMTLATTDVVTVQATSASVSFSLFGSEVA